MTPRNWHHLTRRLPAGLFLAALLLATPLLADPQVRKSGQQEAITHELVEKLRKMTPEERDSALRDLPPVRRLVVQRRLEALERLSQEQRQKLENTYAAFQDMKPDDQREVRRLMREFNASFDGEARPVARTLVRRMRKMSLEERKQFLERPAAKERFTDAQRELLSQMAEKLP